MVLTICCALTSHAGKDMLIIYGKDFSFGVKEPENWHCYTEDAYRYKLNAYFCLEKTNIDSSPAIMNIRVLDKHGYSVQHNLAFDMEKYRKQTNKAEFLAFNVGKLRYEYASKKYLIDNLTADYVCYIDPGDKLPLCLIFVLHGPKDECKKYEKDFIELVKSFTWLTGDVRGLKK
jgi:hypothetical protein